MAQSFWHFCLYIGCRHCCLGLPWKAYLPGELWYREYGSEAFLVNFTAIVAILYGSFVIFTILSQAPPEDHEYGHGYTAIEHDWLFLLALFLWCVHESELQTFHDIYDSDNNMLLFLFLIIYKHMDSAEQRICFLVVILIIYSVMINNVVNQSIHARNIKFLVIIYFILILLQL